jgi:hypothetical protein
MNNNQNVLSRVHEIINKGSSGIIVIPPNSTPDAIAAACSLYLGLTKIGKNVTLASTSVPQSDVMGADKIKTQFATGGDSLMVSFPYSDGSIDKVDYNIQGAAFNLIITPRSGYSKLDPAQVSFSYTGGTVDFIIVIDSPTLNNLGAVYADNQNHFTGRDIINIDRHLTNAFFGTVNYVNKTSSSMSELVLSVLQELKIEIDRDMATNLYSGIATATNNFTSYSVSAETFEHIATLLRLGAVKKLIKKPEIIRQPVITKPNNPVVSHSPTSEGEPTPIEKVEKEVQPSDPGFEQKSPSDWLKPKIFKNGGLI